MRRKPSLAPLQPAPRAPVATFGAPNAEGGGTNDPSDQRAGSPQTDGQEIAFSSVGGSSSAPADAIEATLAG